MSKGRLQKNEGLEKGLKRAIREEIGIEVEVIMGIGKHFYSRSKLRAVEVTYFLGKTTGSVLCLEKKTGLNEARWFTYEQVKVLDLHSDLKPMIFRTMDEVVKKYSAERAGWIRRWVQNCLKKLGSGLL